MIAKENLIIEKFIKGEKISNDEFIELCDKFNVKIHPFIKKWCKNKLVDASKKGYSYKQGKNIANKYYNNITGGIY